MTYKTKKLLANTPKSLTRDEAIYLLKHSPLPIGYAVMCQEYGKDNCDPGEEDWFTEVVAEDLDSIEEDDNYKTFQLWREEIN